MSKEKIDFIKKSSIKNYLLSQKKTRSTLNAIDFLGDKFNSLIVQLLDSSIANAYENKRKTVMKEDIIVGISKSVTKEDLNWEEILSEILKESPADIGKISKGINDELMRESSK